MPGETRKFHTTFGNRKAGIEFSRTGPTYHVRSWGLTFEEIVKYQTEFFLWVDDCLNRFSNIVGHRLDLTTSINPPRPFAHYSLRELDPASAREMDLNPQIVSVPVQTKELTESERDSLLKRMKKHGGIAKTTDGKSVPIENVSGLIPNIPDEIDGKKGQ